MNAKWSVIVVALWAFGCGPGSNVDPEPEQCGNQIDEDKDGLIDCADPDCLSDVACEAAPQCSQQTQCFPSTYDYFDYINEPMPRCDDAKKCVTEGQSIDLRIQLKKDVGWSGTGWETPGATIRLIKKTAVDGTPVTCDLINSIATGNTAADADALEKSGRFNYLAFEAQSVNNSVGQATLVILSNVTTGSDFIVFAELWSGRVATATHYPSGKRFEWRCFDNAAQYPDLLKEITPEDAWPEGMSTPTSRTMNVIMQGPQNP